MNRTEEGLFIATALVVLTLAILYGVQSLFMRPAAAEDTPPAVVTPHPRATAPAPVTAVPTSPDQTTRAPTPAPTSQEVEEVPAPAIQAPATPPAQAEVPSAPLAPATPPPTPAPAAPTPATDAFARGRELTRLLYSERLEELWAAFLPAVRADWRGFADFRAYRRSGLEAYGAETRVLDERVTREGSLTYYTRTATFERGPREAWTLIFGLNARGQVQEFGIVEAGAVPNSTGQTRR